MSEGLHEALARSHSKLMRGQVWCRACGHTERVDPVQAFARGWPKHCSATMTIDAPDERLEQ